MTLQPLHRPECDKRRTGRWSSLHLSPEVVSTSGEGKRALYRAMAWVEQQYHECLLESEDAEPARRYLQERGITEESIRKFHVGFAPMRRDWLSESVPGEVRNGRRFSRRLEYWLEATGGAGGYYDRFRGRLLFSIRDTQDRAVGIGGRILPESGLTSQSQVRQLTRDAALLEEQVALRFGRGS